MATPTWKRIYDAIEAQASPVLTDLASSKEFRDAATLLIAVQKRARDDMASMIRRSLHGVNLPSGTDVQKVSNQVAVLEQHIRQLQRRIDELQAQEGDDQ